MTTMYVREQGARIAKQGERLRVLRGTETLQEIAVRDLDQVVVYGNIQLTTQAANLLVQHDVDVVFYSMYGGFRYRLQQSGSRYANLRKAQLRMSDDHRKSLQFATAVVRGKLDNQERLLNAIDKKLTPVSLMRDIHRGIEGVRAMSANSLQAGAMDSLRGYEGKGATFYFGAMRALVPRRWGFRSRQYHPPPDPWNATLSFGYTLLLKDVMARVQLVGLDPYVGFFHALEANRPSLALDLMEEFRPLVDEVALRMLLANQLPLTLYKQRNGQTPAVLMGPDLTSRLIKAYENRLEGVVFHPVARERTPIRRCLELQSRQMAEFVLGKRQQYQPLLIPFTPLKINKRGEEKTC